MPCERLPGQLGQQHKNGPAHIYPGSSGNTTRSNISGKQANRPGPRASKRARTSERQRALETFRS
eukprot:10296177-Alexandrium_andersonii.AAC.1